MRAASDLAEEPAGAELPVVAALVVRNSIALVSDSILVAAKQTPHQEEAGMSKENKIVTIYPEQPVTVTKQDKGPLW